MSVVLGALYGLSQIHSAKLQQKLTLNSHNQIFSKNIKAKTNCNLGKQGWAYWATKDQIQLSLSESLECTSSFSSVKV